MVDICKVNGELPTYLPTEQKRFFDFAETLHINNNPQDNFEIFRVKRENFLVGLKFNFEFEIFVEVGKMYKGFPLYLLVLHVLHCLVSA